MKAQEEKPLPPAVEEVIELLAIMYHTSPNGEAEYGCGWPDVPCPGVLRLMASIRQALKPPAH